MSFSAEAFLLEEYKALRKEVEIFLAESRALERYTVVALSVIWGWLIKNNNDNWIIWMIPVVFTIIAFIRRVAINKHFKALGDYIRNIEKTLLLMAGNIGQKKD